MKSKFKSNKCKYPKNILNKLITLSFILVVLLTFFLFHNFNKNINSNLIEISNAEINRVTYSFITNKINNNILNSETLKDILIINKNEKGEILYVDFNLDKSYKLLDKISLILSDSIKDLENGEIDVAYLDNSLTHKANGIILSIPLGSTLKTKYFYNLGPKIPVKVNFIGSVLTNLQTKVTNYGLNNALVEVFIYLEFHNQIMTPFNIKDIEFKYDAVIASMMIEGEVPSFYNGSIEKSSNIYSKEVK